MAMMILRQNRYYAIHLIRGRVSAAGGMMSEVKRITRKPTNSPMAAMIKRLREIEEFNFSRNFLEDFIEITFSAFLAGQSPSSAQSCSDCGAKNLEVFFTSTQLGRTVCQTCFEKRQADRRAKEAFQPK
jgi:hypothetical protein